MNIPKNLVDRLRAGKVIPFVGAGVSMAVKDKDTGERLFPSWKELLEHAASRLEEEGDSVHATLVRALLQLNKQEEYLEAARRAREGLIGALWSNFLKEQFDVDPERASDESLRLPQSIWDLGSSLLITTNYDRVMHWACPQLNKLNVWDIEATAEQVAALSRGLQRPTVWHLHGYIDKASNIILTRDGYRRLYSNDVEGEKHYHAALATLRQLLTTHTFLFIGYSLDDRHFGMQLRGLYEIFEGQTETHYVLAHAAEVDKIKALNLPVVPVPFEDYGEPILNLVQELGRIASESKLNTNTEHSVKIDPVPTVASYDPRNPVFYVPFRSKGEQVIGREDDILAVREQLTQGRRTSIGQTAAFRGLGGLGKTQLAVEYAYRYRDEYANGVIWLNADQDIDAQLTDLAEKARWIAPESEHKYKLEIAQQRLRTYSDCLIIFDNVESLSVIENYLPEPQANPHLLITSRNEQPGFPPVSLDLLNDDLSLKLLLQEAGRKQKPTEDNELDAAREIARTLDGLPLALELAGAYVRYRQVRWQKYLELLKQNLKAALPGKLLGGSFTQHEKDIYSTLKINEEFFKDEPRLQDILDLLTWSGSSPMGLSLMCALFEVKKPVELTSALSLGTALRLLQKSPNSESYAIHRLVREVRREDVPLVGREEWINKICQLMGDWFQERKEKFEDLPAFEAEIDHLQAWQQYALKYAPKHASRLIWLQAYPSYHRGRYQETKEWIERALEFFEQLQTDDLELKTHLLNDLGYCHSSLGESKRALNYYEKALEIRLGLLGERHTETARSFNNVGASYGKHGEYRRALEYKEKALAIQLDLFGERHPDTATSFNNVGTTYGDLGDHKRALEYKEKALAIRLDLFGERHPNTATSFSNVGTTYGDLGDHKRALEYKEKALAIQLDLFGERHPATAMSFNNVGTTYSDLGDHKRALEYQEKAFNLSRDMLGDQHPDTVLFASNLVYDLFKLNRHLEALRLTDGFLQKLPKDHLHYELLKQRKQEILSHMPGFRPQPTSKQRKKSKNKKRR